MIIYLIVSLRDLICFKPGKLKGFGTSPFELQVWLIGRLLSSLVNAQIKFLILVSVERSARAEKVSTNY